MKLNNLKNLKELSPVIDLDSDSMVNLAKDSFEAGYTVWCETGKVTSTVIFWYAQALGYLNIAHLISDQDCSELRQQWSELEFVKQVNEILTKDLADCE